MPPIEQPITNVIREAILNRENRNGIFFEIENELYISRAKAKQLFFSFLWHPTEQYLQDLLDKAD